MRPTYETQKNREAEERIAAALQSYWGFRYRKNKPYYPVDYSIMTGASLVGLAELKERKYRLDTIPDGEVMVSMQKVSAGWTMSTMFSITFILAFEFLDSKVPAVCRFSPGIVSRTGIGGRTDRNDPDDLEPVVYIPRRFWCPASECNPFYGINFNVI